MADNDIKEHLIIKELLIQACNEFDDRYLGFKNIPEIKGWWDNYRSTEGAWAKVIIEHKKNELQEACDEVSKLQDEIETLEKEDDGC